MKNRNKIPKSFEVNGQEIKVKKRSALVSTHGDWGQTRYTPSEIHIQTRNDGIPVTDDQVQITFWHECCHIFLHTIGRNDLNQDEAFVDLMGQCIYQVIKTSKY